MNPPKVKTIVRAFAAVPGQVWRSIVELGANASAAFAWLQSHVDGWRFEVEQLAAAIGVSKATAYRAVAALEGAQYLAREPDRWVLLPSLTGENPRAVAKERAGITREKNQTPRVTNRHDRVGRRVDVGQSVSQSQIVKTPPNAPDRNEREPVPEEARVPSLPKFVDAWRDEFPKTGPAYGIVPGSTWQQRLIWIRLYWTADELRTAFLRTRDASPRSPWRYFCTLLEAMSRGTFDQEPKTPTPQKAANTIPLTDEKLAYYIGRMKHVGAAVAACKRCGAERKHGWACSCEGGE